jgi:hypothetical protein
MEAVRFPPLSTNPNRLPASCFFIFTATNRERILTKLSNAGLIDLEFRYTEHNAYIRTKITEKGAKLIQKIRGIS